MQKLNIYSLLNKYLDLRSESTIEHSIKEHDDENEKGHKVIWPEWCKNIQMSNLLYLIDTSNNIFQRMVRKTVH